MTSYGMLGRVFHGLGLKVNPNFNIKKIIERNNNFSEIGFPEVEIVRSYDFLSDKEIEFLLVNTPDLFHFDM